MTPKKELSQQVRLPPPSQAERRFRPTFSIASVLLLTLVLAVMASAGKQLVQAVSKGSTGKAPFVFATLTLPMFALLGVSLTRYLVLKVTRRHK